MTKFYVSIITMDHINFHHDIKLVDSLGVDGLHIDVMDGKFVPRFGVYPEIVERINDISALPLDLHFMVDDIFFSLNQFRNIKNLDTVTFHIEACFGNELRAIDCIRAMGAKPIVGINLATNFNLLDRLITNNEIDGIMLMGIHPGVLEQEARPKNIINDLGKLKEILVNSTARNYIALDGAINFNTMPSLLSAGVTNFIGGSSSIFKDALPGLDLGLRDSKIKDNWKQIKNILSL